MKTDLSKALDGCLVRIENGEAVNSCLAKYPHLRQQLVPLLYSSLYIATAPKVSASDDFRKRVKGCLMARLRQEAIQAETSHQDRTVFNGFGVLWRGLERVFTSPAKVAIPLTLTLILILQGFFFFGSLNFAPSPLASALASHCTLSTLEGNVQMQIPGSTVWEDTESGTTLTAGSRIRTAPDSQALLTFFNGTTVKLESGTDLVVEQLEVGGENQPITIVLKQTLGKTWSRVIKLADPASHYEIQTPSGIALVRGTLFVTEVDDTGAMRVQTVEGLVSVSAQGEEVYLPAGQQTVVEPGTSPAKPMPVSPAEDEELPGQGQKEPSGKIVATESTIEKPEASEVTRQKTDDKEPAGQSQEAPTAQHLDNEEVLSQEQGGNVSWGDQSDTWMITVVITMLLFSSGMAAVMWRRH